MSANVYAVLGLTAIVAALVAVLVYTALRFAAAAREAHRLSRTGQSPETALVSVALEGAFQKLKAQERASAARADASERLNGEIIGSLTAGLLVAGLEGGIRIINPAGRRLLGVPDTAPIEACRDVLNEFTLSHLIDECLSTGTAIVRRTLALPERARGVSHLGVTVSPLFDHQGALHGAICLFTDLSAIKDLEEQLRLKESLATVGELTAGIAHEFRNGLATIHGYGKLLDVAQLPEPYRPYVLGIRSEVDALGQVVTNFLNFARPAQLVLSPIDLQAVCERAADEIRSDVQALGGDVVVRGEFGALDGDEVLLRQAFGNLLRNAFEACNGVARPPSIVIRSEIDPLHKVSRIAVDDNGPGITPEARERVFRPFFTSKGNGTGLGLALVQKIVVFHNGRITAGASSMGGASLHITLPTH